VELRGLEPLAFWMQISGTFLLGWHWCGSDRVPITAWDGRSADGLLYLAAVWVDRQEQERRQGLGLLEDRPAPEGSFAVGHLSLPDHWVRTGSTAACIDLIHTWDNAGTQPLFRPAPHLPRPPLRPSRRPLRFRDELWDALAYAGVRSP
jgi:hypothetical protein